MPNFELDHRLENDCRLVCDLELSRVLLMNDSRWPWLILVPRVVGATEIHQLENDQQLLLQQETSRVAGILSEQTQCTKINSGALGNIVRQLHVHIIARFEDDANWPGPVWGFGQRREYQTIELEQLINSINQRLLNNG